MSTRTTIFTGSGPSLPFVEEDGVLGCVEMLLADSLAAAILETAIPDLAFVRCIVLA